MNGPRTPRRTWQTLEAPHLLVGLVFLVALTASALDTLWTIVEALAGGILGYALAAFLFYVWRERTRPRASLLWGLGIAAWLVFLAIVTIAEWVEGTTFFFAILMSFPPSLLARHDNGLAPTIFIAGGLWFSLFATQGLYGSQINRLDEADAVWVATTMVLAIAAATLEHERQVRRQGPGTATSWVVFRLVFVATWTLVILTLREDVRWGHLFVLLGIDLTSDAGRFLLIGLLVAAIAVAAFAFRPVKKRQPPG